MLGHMVVVPLCCAFPRLRTITGVDGAVRRSQGPTTACARRALGGEAVQLETPGLQLNYICDGRVTSQARE